MRPRQVSGARVDFDGAGTVAGEREHPALEVRELRILRKRSPPVRGESPGGDLIAERYFVQCGVRVEARPAGRRRLRERLRECLASLPVATEAVERVTEVLLRPGELVRGVLSDDARERLHGGLEVARDQGDASGDEIEQEGMGPGGLRLREGTARAVDLAEFDARQREPDPGGR